MDLPFCIEGVVTRKSSRRLADQDSPITCRTWLSSGALWSCQKQSIAESEARTSPSSNSVDIKLRRLNRDTRRRGLVHDFVPTVETRHVGRGSAHIDSVYKLDLSFGPFTQPTQTKTHPMIGYFLCSSQLVRAYPTTPPAGPLRILLSPEKLSRSRRPPSLPMNSTRGLVICPSLSWASNPLKNPSRYSRRIGVRYASAVDETPRGTTLIIGSSCDDSETCVNPISRASFPICVS